MTSTKNKRVENVTINRTKQHNNTGITIQMQQITLQAGHSSFHSSSLSFWFLVGFS